MGESKPKVLAEIPFRYVTDHQWKSLSGVIVGYREHPLYKAAIDFLTLTSCESGPYVATFWDRYIQDSLRIIRRSHRVWVTITGRPVLCGSEVDALVGPLPDVVWVGVSPWNVTREADSGE